MILFVELMKVKIIIPFSILFWEEIEIMIQVFLISKASKLMMMIS